MPKYVDGYILPIPKKNVRNYQRIAKKASKIWMDHGALDYRETIAEDLQTKWGTPFQRQLKLKKGETVVLAYVVFKSRADRDRVNKKVMEDPRLNSMMDINSMPFDMKRMVYGGFTTLVGV
jgi:uncharacterized protein YbaA (DUF1428 family)